MIKYTSKHMDQYLGIKKKFVNDLARIRGQTDESWSTELRVKDYLYEISRVHEKTTYIHVVTSAILAEDSVLVAAFAKQHIRSLFPSLSTKG